MSTVQKALTIRTKGRGLVDITDHLRAAVSEAKITTGLCAVFCAHTSASIVIQENADPAVLRDLEAWMGRLAPEDESAYEHDAEGPDDMPAHLRSSVTRSSETLPVTKGRLAIGTWQAIYLWEHRRAPHERSITVTVFGDP